MTIADSSPVDTSLTDYDVAGAKDAFLNRSALLLQIATKRNEIKALKAAVDEMDSKLAAAFSDTPQNRPLLNLVVTGTYS